MPALEELKDQALKEVDQLFPAVNTISHSIHDHPELGFQEKFAHSTLVAFARENGFKVETPVGGLDTAFRASYRGAAGPTIALLAEYDALPKVGHGCGHNLICTAASAAAIAVARAWPTLPGEIVIMGTPAEEGGGGKIIMIDRGVFDDVDLSMMFHPTVSTAVNTPSLAAANLTFTYSGVAAHSSMTPWLGVNAADAAMLFFSGVNALRQHVTPDVRLHGFIAEAGVKPNIVPDRSAVEFMVRANTKETLEDVVERVLKIARGAELMTGASLEVERGLTYLDYRHSATLGAAARANLERLQAPVTEIGPNWPRASGDAGNVSHLVPHLSLAVSISDQPIPGHSPEWRDAAISSKGEWALETAAKTLALTALDVFASDELLTIAKAEQRTAIAH